MPISARPIAVAAVVATALAGLDLAIVSTAMPTVAARLGGLELYAWTFSAYLLTSTLAIPVYGLLADRVGRKPTFLAATSIFVVGSAACGLAQSMPQLIAARLLQGAGGGGIYPLTLTIVGDRFPTESRARLLGILAAIWGISALAGPAVGGFLAEQLSWRLAFLVQLPLAMLAMALIAAFLHEPAMAARDSPPAAAPPSVAGPADSALSAARPSDPTPSDSASSDSARYGAAPSGQRSAPRLVPPLGATGSARSRVVLVGAAACFAFGVPLYGQTAFVPPLLQGVLGASPTVAGLTLSCTSLGWPVASNLCAWLIPRRGYRATGVLGAVLLALGFVGLALLTGDSPVWLAAALNVVCGLGFGFVSPVLLLAMQNAVGWSERGLVTGVNQFAQSLGGTLGIAFAGALFSAGLNAGSDLRAALWPAFVVLVTAAALAVPLTALLPGEPPASEAT